MDASTHGKHMTVVDGHVKEAFEILEAGVQRDINEMTALLCADTQLMLAEMELKRARGSLKNRMTDIEWGLQYA
jgi:hypothetical protein